MASQNLENLQGASQDEDRTREVEKHAEHERSLLRAEISRLQALVEDVQAAKREANESVTSSATEVAQLRAELDEVRSDRNTALEDNDDLLQQLEELKIKAAESDGLEDLHDEQTKNMELRETVRSLQKDLEATRSALAEAASGISTSDLSRRLEETEKENRSLLNEVEDLRQVCLP